MKIKLTISIVFSIFCILLFGLPQHVEQIFEKIFTLINLSPVSIDFHLLIQISFLGTIIFALSNIGRFEEHKINLSFINHYNKQINLLTQLSYVTVTYFFYLVISLFVLANFSNAKVVEGFKTLIYSLVSITNYYILFLFVKVFIFEPIMDDWDLSEFISNDDLQKIRNYFIS